MLRSKSKDRKPSREEKPGLYMSKRQMGEFLQDLRSNRPTRPTGARPLPSSFLNKRYSTTSLKQETETATAVVETEKENREEGREPPQRCASAQSLRRSEEKSASVSSKMGRPLVRSPAELQSEGELSIVEEDELPYLERGQRWMERQEAHSLRRALEDMDVKKDQALFDSAQKEAAELVWKHQNPNAPYAAPEAQPGYRDHLKRGSTHARTASWNKAASEIQARQSKRLSSLSSGSRSVSGWSKSSKGSSSRLASGGSMTRPNMPTVVNDEENDVAHVPKDSSASADSEAATKQRTPRKRSVSFKEPINDETQSAASRPGLLRHLSRSRSRSKSPEKRIEQSSEEQTQTQAPRRVPSLSAATRIASNAVPANFRNPFSRARDSKRGSLRVPLSRASTEPIASEKPLHRVEIQRNPPTRSRNPLYTVNNVGIEDTVRQDPEEEEVKLKDGKEIRSDDIRKATSASLRDRSSKLPTPSMVSDSPGRPIVSFQKDWKPREVELKQMQSPCEPTQSAIPQAYPPQGDAANVSTRPRQGVQSSVSMKVPDRSKERASPPPSTAPPVVHVSTDAEIPITRVRNGPPIPMIAVNDAPPPIPTIAVSDAAPQLPARAVNRPIPKFAFNAAPAVSSRAVSEIPSMNVSQPATSRNASQISIDQASTTARRPLPTPAGRPLPQHAMTAPAGSLRGNPHITPSGRLGRASGAVCSGCYSPIVGRIVSAAGVRFHPECFRCHHCAEGLECVAFYPEPESARLDRVNRIRDRIAGYVLDERPGQTAPDDGDEALRFYCHLDYHEFFSPRCKSCKTPIEGEVVVACGAEWHLGHFFCAQCGDPFDDKTPFVEKDGYAWCVNCHTHRFSTKCKKCRKPVTDTVVKALNAEWHEQCFSCMECSGKFTDGRYFMRTDGTGPFCPGCEERRLKA